MSRSGIAHPSHHTTRHPARPANAFTLPERAECPPDADDRWARAVASMRDTARLTPHTTGTRLDIRA